MSKVDEILQQLWLSAIYSDKDIKTAPIPHAKSQLLELMLECVGEDETDYPSLNLDKTPHENAVIRNQNRAEIRTNIHKAFGVDNE